MKFTERRTRERLFGVILALWLSWGIAACAGAPQPDAAPATQAPTTGMQATDTPASAPSPVAQATQPPAATVTPAPAEIPTAIPTSQPTQTPVPQTGHITGAVVNVRSGPGTTTAILGKLKSGDEVQITGQRPGWYEIIYPSNSDTRGWVSAELAAPGLPPTATPRPAAVPAPVIVGYEAPNVLWQWDGESTVSGRDWFFDMELIQGGNNQPYDTVQANPSDAVKVDGVWSFAQPREVLCDTTLTMAIATRKDGWISPLSNGIQIGAPCECDDPCPGCGDGGCAN